MRVCGPATRSRCKPTAFWANSLSNAIKSRESTGFDGSNWNCRFFSSSRKRSRNNSSCRCLLFFSGAARLWAFMVPRFLRIYGVNRFVAGHQSSDDCARQQTDHRADRSSKASRKKTGILRA